MSKAETLAGRSQAHSRQARLSVNGAAPAVASGSTPERLTKLAAIDIGSNSIHMLMVELSPPYSYRVLGRDKEMVGLGRGGYTKHRLTRKAMDDACATLARFRKLALSRGIDNFRVVATSAVREATNGGDFIERVRRELSLEIKVVSGREEGRLVRQAVRHAIDFGADTVLVVDLGGGSLELVAATREDIVRAESFKLGAARMAEMFLTSDPATTRELEALEQHIRATLAASRDLAPAKASRAIGTSGTIGALAEICARAADNRPAEGKTAPARVERARLQEVYRKMSKRTVAERRRMPGMDPRRAEQVVAGAAVLLAVMETLDLKEIEVGGQSLRDGIVLKYIERHQRSLLARQTYPDPRERTVRYLAERCAYHRQHAEQVARLALALFDALRPLHGLPEVYRELLNYAGLLHDIGYLIGQDKHHLHSEYLIRNGELKGFTAEEVAVIAATTRCHRGPRPGKRSRAWRDLSAPAQRAVRRLAALLRLAEKLDRTHNSVVENVSARVERDRVVLTLNGKEDEELEVWAANQTKKWFEATFDLPLVIEQATRNRSPRKLTTETRRHGEKRIK